MKKRHKRPISEPPKIPVLKLSKTAVSSYCTLQQVETPLAPVVSGCLINRRSKRDKILNWNQNDMSAAISMIKSKRICL
jgi:hypothetical protein